VRRIYPKADDIPEKLEDRSEPEDRSFYVEPQQVPQTHHEVGQMKIDNQQPILGSVTMTFIGGVLQQVAQGQEVAFLHHAEARVGDRSVKFHHSLTDRRELQAICVDDRQEVVAVKLLPQDLQTNRLNVKEEHRYRQCQN
jgi:hypothetical protein